MSIAYTSTDSSSTSKSGSQYYPHRVLTSSRVLRHPSSICPPPRPPSFLLPSEQRAGLLLWLYHGCLDWSPMHGDLLIF